MPYLSRKIWRLRACTHQIPQWNEAQYAVSREDQYAVLEIWNEYNILEDIKRDPYSKKSPIRLLNAAWDADILVASENALPCYDRQGYNKILEHAKPRNDPDGRHLSALTYLRLNQALLEEHNLGEFLLFVKRMPIPISSTDDLDMVACLLLFHDTRLPQKYTQNPDEVFSIWKAFGGNTHDLDSFGEEIDKTTNLHQHLSRLCSQRLETASPTLHDTVTTHLVTASQQCFTKTWSWRSKKAETNFGILVSKNNVFYFNVIPNNGIYEIDMHDLVPNVNSIYNVSTKRAKHNLDSTYLWHCRLAHISKMTRKSFLHRPERATDLLGIIHTYVCGPLRHVSRQGASYFITFTDDYSRYGYAYLLKHKHEDYALESATHILNMVPTKKVDKTPYELWYTEFFEKNLITQEVSGRVIDLEEVQDEDTSPCKITSETPMEVEGFEPPQEEVILIRWSERTHRAPDHLCLNVEVEEHSLGDLNEPTSYKVAMLDSESNKWINAMNAEIKSMMDNMVWVLVNLPSGCKIVGNIYMVQPEGFVDPNHPRKVCKLQRSIYGLKQASRSWNKRFDEEIKRFGFDQNLDEPCVYQKASGSNVTFLILYVDDIIIMGNHIPSLQSVKDYLGKCFAMKDLGEAAFILGIKIYRDMSKRLIGLGASTPKEVKRMQNVPYASAMGSIRYALRCTRPDVAFAQNITSRFQQNTGESHWTAVKNILKYLRNTKDMFLVYSGNPEAKLRVDCYCNAGFETDIDDMKSRTGYISF
ncbi:retrotransposon protein, putative, ty1-copia subclass [Tanacetum coccineum]